MSKGLGALHRQGACWVVGLGVVMKSYQSEG